MLTATSGLRLIRSHYTDECRDLFRILLNATSVTEANLALEVLKSDVPEKALVSACNLREVIASLPCSPFAMRVDEETLRRTAGLERKIAVLSKFLPDGDELIVTTAGNLVLDLIVGHRGDKYFWTPIPLTDDRVSPEVVDLIVESGYLLDEVMDLVTCMGIVFSPRFYLSLEDWCLEHAAEALGGLGDLF